MSNDPEKTEKDRFTLWLPKELLRELRKRALDEDRPASDLIADAIRDALKQPPRKYA